MSAERPRVLLLGLGPTTRSALEALTPSCDVVGLVRPGSDGVTDLARQLGVPVLPDGSQPAVRDAVRERNPECVAVSSYDRILPPDLVDERPFVNVHYAPLPRLRGRATVNWALLNGDDKVWISIHRLVPGLDAGGILFQSNVPIGPRDDVADLYAALNEIQRQHLAEAVRRAISGDPGTPQLESDATYACTRVPDDGEVDWGRSTEEIDRQIRAVAVPFPGAYTWWGLQRLWIEEAEPAPDARIWEGRVPGRVVNVDHREGSVDVLTGSGVLRVLRVRCGSGAPADAASVIRSVKATLGLRTADLVAALQTLLAREG